MKALAVRELVKIPQLNPIDRLALYKVHEVDSRHLIWVALRQRYLRESRILGLDTTVLIATMREQLRALPSNKGKSPLPEKLEMLDVYKKS